MEASEKIIAGMVAGYGSGFPGLDELFNRRPNEQEFAQLLSPISLTGRYYKSVKFMEELTSGKAVGILRFEVIKKYLIAISELMDRYEGLNSDQKIITSLNKADREILKNIGSKIEEVYQAQSIEKFTEHDTAAAGDYIKLKLAAELPHLANYLEAVCYAETSEDTMGNVFGIILNRLIFGHFLFQLVDFLESLIDYTETHEADGALLLPELTHLQAAEPTTLRIKFIIRIKAIIDLLKKMSDSQSLTNPFSGKMGGAIGNLTCHFAAYPDINWFDFAEEYVQSLGLKYEKWTDQCVSYANEAQHLLTISNILNQVIKLTEDFIRMASCPAQLFVKKPKKGVKGSSIMPNKYNAWMMEGAVEMLRKARNSFQSTANALTNYPSAGNMGRSFLLREIGNDFMPVFIAFDRITTELNAYIPNQAKIKGFFDEYPGMSGSSLQTLLKRMRIEGDAYRQIQEISINKDGSYANSDQFRNGLEEKMISLNLSEKQKEELRASIDPLRLVLPAHREATKDMHALHQLIEEYKSLSANYL